MIELWIHRIATGKNDALKVPAFCFVFAAPWTTVKYEFFITVVHSSHCGLKYSAYSKAPLLIYH